MLRLDSLRALLRAARFGAGSSASRSRKHQEQRGCRQADAVRSHLLSSMQTPRARGAHTPSSARSTSSSKQWMSHWRIFSSRSLVAEWPENVLLISSSRGGSYLLSTWNLFLSCSGVGLLLCSARRSGEILTAGRRLRRVGPRRRWPTTDQRRQKSIVLPASERS